MPLLTFLISQFLYMRPCGLYFSLLSSPFYANPIWFPITRDKFPPRLSHGQIWSSLPLALIFMSQLLKPFSASNALLFYLFPRSLGLVFIGTPDCRLRLCPISALRHHLSLNPGPSSAPLFTVLLRSALEPITYKQFFGFLSWVVSRLHLEPSLFSPHRFRRGGATFAFDCHNPSEIIKLQGDWQSDAYLVYLELSQQQKQRACHAMASKLQSMFPA